jgi:hypothetical protein
MTGRTKVWTARRRRATGLLVPIALLALALAAPAGAAKPGSLDHSFGRGGVVAIQPPLSRYDAWFARGAAAGPHGFVYVLETVSDCSSGEGSCRASAIVVRYRRNGERDLAYGGAPGYASAGQSPAQFGESGLAVDAEGRAVVVQALERGLAVTRFTAGGAPDPEFGLGGRTYLACSCYYQEPRAAVAADGSVVVTATRFDVTGEFVYGPSTKEAGTHLARLTPGGALDTSFGSGGELNLSYLIDPGPWALRKNRSVLISDSACCPRAEYLSRVPSDGGEVNRDFALAARLRGIARPPVSIAVRPNGSVLLIGNAGSTGHIVALRANGALAKGFGRKGVARFPRRTIYGGAVGADGKAFVVGASGSGPLVFRLKGNGRIDKRFINGLRGISNESGRQEALYSGLRPMVFDAGGDTACRTYCQPHPLLYRFSPGPKPKQRR